MFTLKLCFSFFHVHVHIHVHFHLSRTVRMLHEISNLSNEFVIITCQKPLKYLTYSAIAISRFATAATVVVATAVAALFRSSNEPLIALNCLIGLNKNAVNYYNFSEMLESLIAFKQQSVIPWNIVKTAKTYAVGIRQWHSTLVMTTMLNRINKFKGGNSLNDSLNDSLCHVLHAPTNYCSIVLECLNNWKHKRQRDVVYLLPYVKWLNGLFAIIMLGARMHNHKSFALVSITMQPLGCQFFCSLTFFNF